MRGVLNDARPLPKTFVVNLYDVKVLDQSTIIFINYFYWYVAHAVSGFSPMTLPFFPLGGSVV